MKILLIPAHFPYPPDDGGKIPSFYLMKYLSRRHRITMATLLENKRQKEYLPEMEKYCSAIHAFPKRPLWSPLNPLIAVFKRVPFIIACSYSREMAGWVRRELASSHYDLILVQFLNCSVNVPDLRGMNSILHIWSIESLTFRRYFDAAWKNKLNLFMREEMRRWKNYEKKVCQKFDRCVTISEEDKAILEREVPSARVDVMPNGVDTEYFKPLPPRIIGDIPQKALIYTGAMNYFPNADAVIYFCNSILPEIRKKMAVLPFYIIGKNPPRGVRNLGKLNDVFVTGYVHDVRQFLTPESVFVVPLRSGTGMRNKILEAMAMQVPVVSTSIGAEGIRAQDGIHLYVRDAPSEFADKVVELYENGKKRVEMIRAARELVERLYNWERAAETIEKVCEDIILDKRSSRRADKQLHIG